MLGDPVITAFESLGATSVSDLRGCYACSHALIGVKEGATFEDSSTIRPARVSLGPPLLRPTVAARFDNFVVESD